MFEWTVVRVAIVFLCALAYPACPCAARNNPGDGIGEPEISLRPMTAVDSRWRRVGAATTMALSYGFSDHSANERRSFFHTPGRYADIKMQTVAVRAVVLARKNLVDLGGEGVTHRVALDAGSESRDSNKVTAKYIQVHATPADALEFLNAPANKKIHQWLRSQEKPGLVLDNIVVLGRSVATTRDLKVGVEVKCNGHGLQVKRSFGDWRTMTDTRPLVYGYKMYEMTGWSGDKIQSVRVDDPGTYKR